MGAVVSGSEPVACCGERDVSAAHAGGVDDDDAGALEHGVGGERAAGVRLLLRAHAAVVRGGEGDVPGVELQVRRRGVRARAGARHAAAPLDRTHLQRSRGRGAGGGLSCSLLPSCHLAEEGQVSIGEVGVGMQGSKSVEVRPVGVSKASPLAFLPSLARAMGGPILVLTLRGRVGSGCREQPWSAFWGRLCTRSPSSRPSTTCSAADTSCPRSDPPTQPHKTSRAGRDTWHLTPVPVSGRGHLPLL